MELRYKDGVRYMVATESDGHAGFMIFAVPMDEAMGAEFCMHYRSLAELNAEWEDID